MDDGPALGTPRVGVSEGVVLLLHPRAPNDEEAAAEIERIQGLLAELGHAAILLKSLRPVPVPTRSVLRRFRQLIEHDLRIDAVAIVPPAVGLGAVVATSFNTQLFANTRLQEQLGLFTDLEGAVRWLDVGGHLRGSSDAVIEVMALL